MFHLLLAVIYLSFISLGLPDSLLGAAWPTMYPQFDVPVSYAGIVSMIICLGTIVSSLQCDRLTRRLGTGRVTAFSVALTAAALWGFSISDAFWQLCLWAIPYGLGAGCVDAALNNYVALHFASRHMSWLHCMWGVGAATGPYIMSWALTGGQTWNMGYRIISVMQIVLSIILFGSLPLWKGRDRDAISVHGAGADERIAAESGTTPEDGVTLENGITPEDSATQFEKNVEASKNGPALSLGQILRIPGAKEIMLMFFCYCALESAAGLWASSYLVLQRGLDAETAASWGSLFYVGITAGRALNGFLTLKWNDDQLIRMGQSGILLGCLILLLPLGTAASVSLTGAVGQSVTVGQLAALVGFILVGLGCAPIYPSVIHSTPEHFGAERSQAIIGVQMASAYVGSCLMPPTFGLIADHISAGLLPLFLLATLILMVVMHEKLCRMDVHAE